MNETGKTKPVEDQHLYKRHTMILAFTSYYFTTLLETEFILFTKRLIHSFPHDSNVSGFSRLSICKG